MFFPLKLKLSCFITLREHGGFNQGSANVIKSQSFFLKNSEIKKMNNNPIIYSLSLCLSLSLSHTHTHTHNGDVCLSGMGVYIFPNDNQVEIGSTIVLLQTSKIVQKMIFPIDPIKFWLRCSSNDVYSMMSIVIFTSKFYPVIGLLNNEQIRFSFPLYQEKVSSFILISLVV